MIYVIVAIVAVILIYIFATYNILVKLDNKVKEAFSTMDVYLKKRWDLIPNLVEIVKGYTKHEKGTLEEIIKLRNGTYDNMSDEDKIKANEGISSRISKIMALAENYPDLKASDNFQNLSNQLSKIEEDIANSRKYYNGSVRIFNDKVQMFPSNILAKVFGYRSKNMYEISSNERSNVKVEF